VVRSFRGKDRVVLLAILLGACGANANNNGTPDNSAASAPAATPTSPPSVSPTSSQTPTSGYDASIGNGVDANGFADLPLAPGAHRYFVSSATGSDSNGCGPAQQPSAPLKSIATAMACVADGAGDQVLVAERTSYSAGLPSFVGKSGFDPAHPTVIQSYDPNDALNDTKYGRAGAGNRPIIDTGASGSLLSNGGGSVTISPKYLAVRGLDFNPGNVPGIGISILPNSSGAVDYVLIENNIFRYEQLIADMAMANTKGNHLVIRNNSFFGQWNTSAHVQGLYYDSWASATVEDNVFWHNGWKIGANRDDSIANGGLVGDDFFRHPIYQQTGADGITRRNLIIDGASDGGQYRGNSTVIENVFIDNPTGIAVGGGTNYDVYRPNGVDLEVSYNAILGDADIDSNTPRGIGIEASNGRSGSSAHHNLIVRSRNVNGVNNWAFITSSDKNQPSYMIWDHNVVYQWTTALQIYISGGSYPSQDFATYTNNIWDAANSGTNTNIAGGTFPNPYTAAQLYSALGFADKQAFINYAIEHPETHIQRQARTLLFAGYGI
jgi:hypothetical protein